MKLKKKVSWFSPNRHYNQWVPIQLFNLIFMYTLDHPLDNIISQTGHLTRGQTYTRKSVKYTMYVINNVDLWNSFIHEVLRIAVFTLESLLLPCVCVRYQLPLNSLTTSEEGSIYIKNIKSEPWFTSTENNNNIEWWKFLLLEMVDFSRV